MSGKSAIMNGRGDNESPWKIPFEIFAEPMILFPSKSSIFHCGHGIGKKLKYIFSDSIRFKACNDPRVWGQSQTLFYNLCKP